MGSSARALLSRYVPLGEAVVFTIPLTKILSKNAQHGIGQGRLNLRAGAAATRDTIGWALKGTLQG